MRTTRSDPSPRTSAPPREDRRWAAAGVALLLLAPGLGAGIGLVGAVFGLGESARSPLIVSVQSGWSLACDQAQSPPCYVNGSTVVDGGLVYIPPLRTFVTASGLSGAGYISEVSPATLKSTTTITTACWPQRLYYPGSGTTAYALCEYRGNQSLLSFDAKAAAVVRSTALPLGTGCTDNLALDTSRGVVYCLDWTGELLGINLASGQVTNGSTLGIGHVLPRGPIWADNRTGAVFLSDARNRSLEVLDPLSGRVSVRLPFSDGPVAILGDTTTDRLYVSYGYPFGNSSVLNLTTFATLATVEAPAFDFVVIDPDHGDVYFESYGNIVALSSGTNQLLPGPPVRVPALGDVAYDPIQDRFVALAVGSQLTFTFTQLLHTTTSPAPFSAIPLLGTWTPEAVGTALLALGVVFLGAWAVPRRRRLSAEGDAWLASIRQN
ncbi:MAG: hypothetical protein L3K15_09450, partial [Thermoplasmata archaeon]|nr:hypothetical protein [Thermoplasmata archaeon]